MCIFLCGMGSKIKTRDAFDSRFLRNFNKGDLVSWKVLGKHQEFGVIIEIYHQDMTAGRKFMFAKVRKSTGQIENFMLSSLFKES